MPYGDKKIKKPTLRRSQSVTTYGVGAIVDLPQGDSVMVCGIDCWDPYKFVPLRDPRLEAKLGVAYFLMAPDAEDTKNSTAIKAVRFPRFLRCRKCHSIRDVDDWRVRYEKTGRYNFNDRPRCDIDGLALIPSRFIAACRKGHIEDFPFSAWAHSNGTVCANPDIKYFEAGNQSSLAGVLIKCETCKRARNMGGSFSRETLAEIYRCKGSKPWEFIFESSCGEQLMTLQRGATNVHFPIVKSSILIPPHSTEGVRAKILKSEAWQWYHSQKGLAEPDFLTQMLVRELKISSGKAADEVEALLGATDEIVEKEQTEEDYRFDEYRAFLGDFQREKLSTKDFLVEIIPALDYDIPYLKTVVLAKKLREIRAQIGFSRVKPAQTTDEEGAEVEEDVRVEASKISETRKKWFPAYEVRGEGIFLEFDSTLLSKWAQQANVTERVKPLLQRSEKQPDAFSVVTTLTPEFIFLHTFAHLLIRQLSFECGYSSSALRERIYCTSDPSKRDMTGILIYTADGDSDGTLGGLVRQGEKELLPTTIMQGVHQAEWCSSDPLCIESEGQGYQAMNLAACHSCAMLPETSCEMLNRYLDRGLVVGTLSDATVGLFKKWLVNQEIKQTLAG